jgi:pyruvate,water dikinase
VCDWDLRVVERPGVDGSVLFDSVPYPGCTEWTATHVDAVLAGVISPLAWTLVGSGVERSQARVWSLLGVAPMTGDDRFRFVARLGGRLHISVTSLRQLAARMPGVDPGRVDAELGLDRSDSQGVTWRDRLWYPGVVIGAARVFGLLPLRRRRQRRCLAAALKSSPDPDAPPAGLVARIEQLRRGILGVLVPHMVVRMMTQGAIDQLRGLCGDDDLAFGLLAELPGLVATEPSLALHHLAQEARVTGQVDDEALDAFVARYGHRGVNELDPTVPVWDQQRQGLLLLIDRLAAGAPGEPAGRAKHVYAQARRQVRQVPRMRRWRIGAAARAARTLQLLGERSKDDLARYIHELRVALRQLIDHLSTRIDPGDATLLSWGELRRLALDAEPLTVDLAERRRELAGCAAGQPPGRSAGGRGATLRGVGASPGHGAGRAVVVDDPFLGPEEGEVLVAHATDTAWIPLFLGKSAVVTDVGGVISHASIVARDLGIPAVVGTQVATTLIRTGDHTDVDGDHGLVTIHR